MGTESYRKNIVDYLKKNLKKGYTEEALKWALVKQGYNKVVVDMALKQAHKEIADKAPILREKPKITYTIIDENNKPVIIKKPWWKKFLGI
jgi:hypothetical protein